MIAELKPLWNCTNNQAFKKVLAEGGAWKNKNETFKNQVVFSWTRGLWCVSATSWILMQTQRKEKHGLQLQVHNEGYISPVAPKCDVEIREGDTEK